MARFDRIAPRIAGAAAVAVVALMAATVPLKPAAADNDDWKHHRHWNGDWDGRGHGGIYFDSSPGYYYVPPPVYYYPPQPYYEGPSFGLSVRIR
jgi:hypothetical protein